MPTRKAKSKRARLRDWPKPRPRSPRPSPDTLPMRTRPASPNTGGTGGRGGSAQGAREGEGGPMERAREWLKLDDPLGRPVQVTFSAIVLNAALLALVVLMAVLMSSCVDRFIK